MFKAAYFDCFSGASGDMIFAALLDAGADFVQIRSALDSLPVKGFELTSTQVKRGLLRASRIQVNVCSTDQPHRNLSDIKKLLDHSELHESVKSLAGSIFERLAQAEAIVHGTSPQEVHFHEVGAVDSIVDIVGSCLALHLLGIDKVYCSQIATGSGTVHCAHGNLPIPAPATAQLLVGVPTKVGYPDHELTTPTGAAVLTTLAENFGPAPDMRTERIGYGAGQADLPGHPNVLRVTIGRLLSVPGEADDQTDQVWLVQTNLDDTPAELVGPLYDLLFAQGALDVYVTPVQMKKNRPGLLLSVLAPPEKLAEIEDLLFKHTPTFGLRRQLCHRAKLSRKTVQLQTRYGTLRVKVGSRAGSELTVSPEFEDCQAAAARHGVSQREVYHEALLCYRQMAQPSPQPHKEGQEK